MQQTASLHPISPPADGAVYREQRDRERERERERDRERDRDVRTTPMVPERDTNGVRPTSDGKVPRQIQKPEVSCVCSLLTSVLS